MDASARSPGRGLEVPPPPYSDIFSHITLLTIIYSPFMIVTIGNTKGGSGKTTLALNLAIARALAGRDVWLIDGDRQASALTAVAARNQGGYRPALACSGYPDGRILRSQVQSPGAEI